MTRIKRVFARIALAVTVVVSMVDVAVAIPNKVSNVPTGRADAVDANNLVCTRGDFENMPNMSKSFSFGGTASQRVIVLFQGLWQWPSYTYSESGDVLVRLTIDGVPQSGQDNGIPLVSKSIGALPPDQMHGFNFVSDLLAPGTHTATLQWGENSVISGCLTFRSLIVLHR